MSFNFNLNRLNLNLDGIQPHNAQKGNRVVPNSNSNDYEAQFNSPFESLAKRAQNIFKFTPPDYINLSEEDLNDIYNISSSATVSVNTPSEDLKTSEFESVDNFNLFIKQNVEMAGYGSREGVVAAALSLVYGYSESTGKRLRYSMDYRQVGADGLANQEGIVNEDFYLDCSSFAMWALYNGGYNTPHQLNGQDVTAYTGSQITWASQTGILTQIENGKPGDFLIHHQGEKGHIVMIIGQYNDGYYCVEFSSPDKGGLITQRTYEDLHASNYSRIDMESYYNNPSNVRK